MTIPRHDMPLGLEPSVLVGGRYAVDREIGRGGTAIVYLARDVRTSRQVALKVLKPEFAGSLTTRRFLNEIALTTGLQHPHILAIQDSGEVSGIPGLDGLPFHVSPYIEGESLRARLERERQLPLDDAIRIATEIADALEHAHAHGVLHRDIKPENILLSGRHACVADFGIARAFARAAGERLTTTGVTVGTPAYMSPEQASGERELDARTDVYSLACVVYEMIAGVPPFVGPSPQAVIAQRFTHPPRPLDVYRPNVPPHVEEAIARAMAILPADRTPSAGALADALVGGATTGAAIFTGATTAGAVRQPMRAGQGAGAADGRGTGAGVIGGMMTRVARRPWAIAALALVAAAFVLGDDVVRTARNAFGPTPDSARYVVLPFAGDGGRVLGPEVARQHLHEALGRWRDLELVSLDAANRETPPGATTLDDRLAAARALRAGRAVNVQLTRLADSVQLRATLYDERGGVLREHTVRVPDADGPHDGYRRLGAALLRVASPPVDTDEGDLGTDLLGAWHAYLRGHEARRRWDLDVAEREFHAAAAADPGFAQAQLWAAQVAAWQRPDHPAGWRDAASRAVARLDRLTPRDALLARGVHALATERYPEACRAYAELQRLLARSDVPWYGIGQCHATDPVVLRDARSPSGWRFRSSFHAAVAAYDSAITLAEGAPAFAFEQLGTLLYTEPVRLRLGRALGPDTASFAAYAFLISDTLATIPYPVAEFAAGVPHTGTGTLAGTLRRNTDLLERYYGTWVQRTPESADALEALALVQERRGARDVSAGGELVALRTVREARRRSMDPRQQVALATSEIRLLVKEGRFGAARALADSVLAAATRPDPEQAVHLAGLAALTGKVGLTAHLLRVQAASPPARSRVTDIGWPPAVADGAATLLAHAALGVCSDTLGALEREVESAIQRYLEGDMRAAAREAVLARPLRLAVPCLGMEAVSLAGTSNDGLAIMQREWAAGRADAVRTQFDALQRRRVVDRPGDVTMDHTFQEAWLLAAIGDSTEAARHLELPLTATTTLGTRMLRDVPQAAALGRAMALRAELAAASGDRATARRWATAVVELWGTADPPLRPVVARMQALAR